MHDSLLNKYIDWSEHNKDISLKNLRIILNKLLFKY